MRENGCFGKLNRKKLWKGNKIKTETFDAYNDFPSWEDDFQIIFKNPDDICEIEVQWDSETVCDIRGRVGDQDFRDIYGEVPNSLIDAIEEKLNRGE